MKRSKEYDDLYGGSYLVSWADCAVSFALAGGAVLLLFLLP
jgi:hypothetical protein